MSVKDCVIGTVVTRTQAGKGKPMTLQVGTVISVPYKVEGKGHHYYTMVQFERGIPIEVYVARLQLQGTPHNLHLVIG